MKFLIFASLVVFVCAQTEVSNLIGGNFTFTSQENFEEYLSAAGVDPEKIKIMVGLKPHALVENKGDDHFTITFTVGNKSRIIDFKLNEVYETDFLGTGDVSKSFTTIVNGDTFSTYDPDHPEIKRYGKFTETQMIMTLEGYGVTANRYFDRV